MIANVLTSEFDKFCSALILAAIFLLQNFIRKDMFIEASFGIVPNCCLFKVMILLSEIYLVTTNNSLHTAFLKYLGIKSKCKIC